MGPGPSLTSVPEMPCVDPGGLFGRLTGVAPKKLQESERHTSNQQRVAIGLVAL